MGYLFISYSRKDRKEVDRLVMSLKKAGYDIWLDRADIRGGDEWRAQIVNAISGADAFIIVLSPNSFLSANVRKELSLAEGAKVKILPITLKQADIPPEMHYQLVGLQRIDFSKRFDDGFFELLESLTGDSVSGTKTISKPTSNEFSQMVFKKIKSYKWIFLGAALIIALAIVGALSGERFIAGNADANSTDINNYRIMFPRGNKVVILWEGMPETDLVERYLREQGISLGAVDQGTKRAFGALAQRNSEDIKYTLWISESGELLPGYSYVVVDPGLAPDAKYGEFQLFQGDEEFSIFFHATQDGEPQGPVIPVEELGVDWDEVREGLSMALEELYVGKKYVEFGDLGILTEQDGSWRYQLPYKLYDR
ncbi:MAG: toll/interleukin-1 receptor domain-containing protein [Anaerolineales bacterium]|nr:toll/interleukin-1 receptor domain-containing protein [Anaerolineales bacterium]